MTEHHPPEPLMADVLIRAWEPHFESEGARFSATTVRRDIEVRVGHGSAMAPQVTTEHRPGLVVIAPSAGPGSQNAVDVVVQAIATNPVRFTILRTPELLWHPLTMRRDALDNWEIDCLPFLDYMRIRLGDNEVQLKTSQDGR